MELVHAKLISHDLHEVVSLISWPIDSFGSRNRLEPSGELLHKLVEDCLATLRKVLASFKDLTKLLLVRETKEQSKHLVVVVSEVVLEVLIPARLGVIWHVLRRIAVGLVVFHELAERRQDLVDLQ